MYHQRAVKRETNADLLLRQIVKLNQKRILSRLGSQHAPKLSFRRKPPLIERLEIANKLLFASRTTNWQRTMIRDIKALRENYQRLETVSIATAHSSENLSVLIKLILLVRTFFQKHEGYLSSIPITPGAWDVNATEALLDRLRKLSQYQMACEVLLKVARRNTAFSNISIKFVDLQQEKMPIDDTYMKDIRELIRRNCDKDHLSRAACSRRKNVSTLCSSVETRLNHNCRLHAEMQLVAHFEQIAPHLRPRVICSSKSACYLCYLLLKLQGKYHTPSTHGRLYPAWQYPLPVQQRQATSSLNNRPANDRSDLLKKFIEAIDNKIKNCLEKQAVGRQPNCAESRVDLLAVITPSVQSCVSRISDRVVKPEIDNKDPETKNISQSSGKEALRRTTPCMIKMQKSIDGTMHSNPSASLIKASSAVDRIAVHSRSSNNTPVFCPQLIDDNTVKENNEHLIKENEANNTEKYSSGTNFVAENVKVEHLQVGETVTRYFDGNVEQNILLDICAPRLHLVIEYVSDCGKAEKRSSCSNGIGISTASTERKQLQLRIECFQIVVKDDSLNKSKDGQITNKKSVVNLDASGSWNGMVTAPENVLFSPDGLLLWRKAIVIRLRAKLV